MELQKTSTQGHITMNKISIDYTAHNASTVLLIDDPISYLPHIGDIIINDSLKDRSCTGQFLIIDIYHIKSNTGFECKIHAIELSVDIKEEDIRSRLCEAGRL